MKTRKIILLLVALVFLLFAIVQYNDPDFYIWIPVYGWVAFLYFAASRNRYYPFWSLISLLLILVWILVYIPAVMEWVSQGSPTITGEMKAESPYIEHMRECLGLVLCLLAVGYLYFRAKRIQHEEN